MSDGSFRKSLYKWAWGTRCRNVDVARVLRPLINNKTSILDVGCGEYGLAGFVGSENIVGVDVLQTGAQVDGSRFVHASIISLPFAERSFSIAASVDVLEHLPERIRSAAVKQLVRVADNAILIAFPAGKAARDEDEAFKKVLTKSGEPIPDWLAEHLENHYPDTDAVIVEIEQEAINVGRKVHFNVTYSETLAVAKFLRLLALASKYLYVAGNLAAGFLLPLLPKAKKETAYRAIILAEFEND